MAMMWRILVAALIFGSLGCMGTISLHGVAAVNDFATAAALLKGGS